MKFFFDENFPKAAAVVLDSLGHQYFDPRGTKFEGKPDEVLLTEARRLDAVFLTTDRDFFHTLRHEFPDHAGIIGDRTQKAQSTGNHRSIELVA